MKEVKIRKQYTSAQRSRILDFFKRSKMSKTAFCLQRRISRRTFTSWNTTMEEGGQYFDKVGRRHKIDEIGREACLGLVETRRNDGVGVLIPEMKDFMNEQGLETHKRECRKGVYEPMSNKTFKTMLTLSGLFIKGAQVKTNARISAEHNILNFLSTLGFWRHGIRFVKIPELVINFDATQFSTCKEAKNNNYKCVASVEQENDVMYKDKPISVEGDSGLGNSVKYYCVCSLNGVLCPTLVMIVADPRLAEGEFRAYPVPGLTTLSMEPGAYGFICFSSTRCPKESFPPWFLNNVLIPFVDMMKRNGEAALDANVFVNCDGEPAQILPLMSKDCMKQMEDSNIMLGKLAASTTAVSQACDAYKIFCTMKAKFRKVTPAMVQKRMKFLLTNLEKACATHNASFSGREKKLKGQDGIIMIIGRAVLAITATIRDNSTIVSDSFNKIGIDSDNFCVDVEKMALQFNVKMSDSEYAELYDEPKMKHASFLFQKYGRMTDKELIDTYDLAKRLLKEGDIIPDNITLHRQRCVILTSEGTRNRWNAKIAQKEADMAEEAAKRERNRLQKEERKRKADEKKAQSVNQASTSSADDAPAIQGHIAPVPAAISRATWCYCDMPIESYNPSHGPMVECSNHQLCKSGTWFHFKCCKLAEGISVRKNWKCDPCSVPKFQA